MNIFETNFKDDFQYMLSTIGDSIKINDKDQVALITKGTNNDKYIDYRNIKTEFPINTGDLIFYENQNWLVIGEVYQSTNSYKATLRKALNDIVFNYYGIFYYITSILDVQILDTTTNQYITLPNGRIQLTLPYSDFLHKRIDLATRIFSMNQPFKVIGIDISRKGLMILILDKDLVNTTYDDVANNIADAFKYSVSIVVSDATNDIIKIQNEKEFDLSYYVQSVYNSTSTLKLTNVECILTSSDENIFTIDNNGHVKAVNQGTANLTITIKDKSTVSKTISIQVTDTAAYSVNVTGNSGVTLNGSATYTATTKINYILNSNESVTWSLTDTNGAATTLATIITSSTGTTCTIKANNSSLKGYVRLRAISTSDNTAYGDIIIQIKSGF